MVVKSQIKLIKSLQQKKHRLQNRLFVVEGIKTVGELLKSPLKIYKVFVTEDAVLGDIGENIEVVGESELKKMSSLATPNKVLGVFHMPKPRPIDYSDWVVALDDVRDPGNLGTIIRLCDWFGIPHLICSPNSVDCYNPKTLQATMGSIGRVNIVYTDLGSVLSEAPTTVYGTFMDGEAVYGMSLPQAGILLMGNEANGISEKIGAMVHQR
ncbi:MAG TPA: RNA methyltransferase, partial [Arenibacter sp.]|nr:RNA methyltransferase [Arenibacter sp.]